MFIGHFAVALAARRVRTRPSLGWTFAACQWPDLLWPILCLVGMEHFHIAPGDTAMTPLSFDYYPWSHSLLMDFVWAVVLGLVWLARRGDKRGAMLIGVLVLSHWVLDWVTHRPDMPITVNNDHLVGLGLWRSVPLTVLVESLLFVGGASLYLRATVPRDRVGRIGIWVLLGFLVVVSLANLVSPPPPSTTAVSVTALALWLVVFAAAWIDRHREPVARV